MKRVLSVPSLAAVLLLGPVLSLATAQDNPPGRPNPPGAGPAPLRRGVEARQQLRDEIAQRRQDVQRPRDLKAELGLTDVQKADLRKAAEASRRDRLRKSTDMKIASMDLRSLMRAEKVDEKAIGLKLAEVQAAQGALLKLRIDAALAMKRILTPEQQKKMSEMRGERGMGRARQRMEQRRQRGPAQGRGGRPMGLRPGRPGESELDDLDFDDLDDDLRVLRPGGLREQEKQPMTQSR